MEASNLFSVEGLVAVITGGGSGELAMFPPSALFRKRTRTNKYNQGLGLTMAKALEANGAAKVFIIGRNFEKLENAAKQGVRFPKLTFDFLTKEKKTYANHLSETWKHHPPPRRCY